MQIKILITSSCYFLNYLKWWLHFLENKNDKRYSNRFFYKFSIFNENENRNKLKQTHQINYFHLVQVKNTYYTPSVPKK